MTKTLRYAGTATLFLLGCALGAGCDALSDRPQEARVVFGESINGVAIGDDSLSVVRELGNPSETGTDWRGGAVLRYTEGAHAGLEVALAPDSAGGGVVRVSARAPYDGRSEEGVGLGSEQDEALGAWPQPERSHDLDSLRYDLYFFGDRFFGVEYAGDRVAALEVVATVEEPEVVWGESIEGIEIGDDSLAVVERVGLPAGMGEEDGVTFFVYERGQWDWIRVSFYDTLGVTSVLAYLRYAGRTAEGVGLGMGRGEVLRRLGPPTVANAGGGGNIDKYGFPGNVIFSMSYSSMTYGEADTLRSILMSYGTPRVPANNLLR